MAAETKTEVKEVDLKKLADAFARDNHIEPGYQYRYVTTGGETVVVVEPIGQKG